ncbi:MAG: hypothetical protein ACE15B_08635 [Bryobacteraceae bacterium]
MLVAGLCCAICALAFRLCGGARRRALDKEDIRRMRRFAEKIRREQALPYE